MSNIVLQRSWQSVEFIGNYYLICSLTLARCLRRTCNKGSSSNSFSSESKKGINKTVEDHLQSIISPVIRVRISENIKFPFYYLNPHYNQGENSTWLIQHVSTCEPQEQNSSRKFEGFWPGGFLECWEQKLFIGQNIFSTVNHGVKGWCSLLPWAHLQPLAAAVKWPP